MTVPLDPTVETARIAARVLYEHARMLREDAEVEDNPLQALSLLDAARRAERASKGYADCAGTPIQRITVLPDWGHYGAMQALSERSGVVIDRCRDVVRALAEGDQT